MKNLPIKTETTTVRAAPEAKQMKKILIVAPFVSLPGEPCFNRFLSLSFLWAQDYDVTLVTSSFCHPQKQPRDRNSEAIANLPFKLVLIDEPGYRSNVSFARFWSHRVFHQNFRHWFINALETESPFDVVYSAFPLISTNLTLGELKSQSAYKLVIDVQDIWPDSIFSAIPFLKTADFLISPLRAKAHKAYGYADGLVAVSKTYLEVALSRSPQTPSQVAYLGSDYALIESIEPEAIANHKTRLFYLGTLSHSYDMETVIHGFSQLQAQVGDVVELHVLGDGPDRKKLETLCAKEKSAKNIHFHGYLPYESMVAFAKSCHIAINPIVGSATQSITNKLSDYIALGHPILSSQRNWEAMELIKSRGGYWFEAGSAESFATAAQKAVLNYCQSSHLETNSPDFNKTVNRPEQTKTSPRGTQLCTPTHTATRQTQTDRLFDRRISYPKITQFIEHICAESVGH